MITFKEYMNNQQSNESSMIEESKLLTSSAVQLRLRSIANKIKNETDTNSKIDLLADMFTTFSMLNVLNSLQKR